MKPAQIFHQYIWIINTLRAFEELNQKWIADKVADGNPLLRHSNGIEVLQPLDLRQKMKEMVAETLKRY